MRIMGLQISGEALRIALFYFVYCCISGLYTPYWPVFLQSRGMSPQEIGFIFAAGSIVRPFSMPAFGYIADRFIGLKRTLFVLSFLTVLALSLFAQAQGFAILLFTMLVTIAVWPTMMPLVDAMALGHQVAGRLTYGRVRLWGSIAFILTTLAGGIILARFGPNGIWIGMVAFAVALVFVALFLHVPELPHGEGGRPTLRELFRLLTASRLGLVLVAGALIDSTHTLYYGFATIHWRAIGVPDSAIGFLWSIGVVAEVLLLAFAGKWLRQSSGLPFMAIAGGACIVRWSLLSLDPSLPILYAVQIIHGLTYAANLLGVMTYIARHAPRRFAGSVQGIYAALASGVFASSAMAMSGGLYARFGAQAYLVMAAIAGVGLCVLAVAWWGERKAALAVP